jgi:ribonuclease R
LVRELGLGGGRERRLLLEQLARLAARGSLVKADRDHWSLPQAASARNNLIAGRLDLHRDGFGFVRPTNNIGTTGENDSARGGVGNNARGALKARTSLSHPLS